MTELQSCQLCPRLTAHRESVKRRFPDYYCAPVPAFGCRDARLLIVGLAPGLHGANASGRPFTGDASGDLLFAALYRFGFASQARSSASRDGMQLSDCRITNAVKCLPPQNAPRTRETQNCSRYLRAELDDLPDDGVILALGGHAHRAVIRALGLRQADYPFGRLAHFRLVDQRQLVCCYHPSRYNLNTGRIDGAFFDTVLGTVRELMA